MFSVLYTLFCSSLGVMLAVDAVIAELKKLSKPVTTPEEIAQVKKKKLFFGKNVVKSGLMELGCVYMTPEYFSLCI